MVAERRAFILSDEDIERIVAGIHEKQTHICRFHHISPEDMAQVIKFNQNFEQMITKTGSIAWTTVLVLTITGVVGLVFLGFVQKIKLQ